MTTKPTHDSNGGGNAATTFGPQLKGLHCPSIHQPSSFNRKAVPNV
ncbi:MAG: hypothetical protein WCS52_00670 [bacterium]